MVHLVSSIACMYNRAPATQEESQSHTNIAASDQPIAQDDSDEEESASDLYESSSNLSDASDMMSDLVSGNAASNSVTGTAASWNKVSINFLTTVGHKVIVSSAIDLAGSHCLIFHVVLYSCKKR